MQEGGGKKSQTENLSKNNSIVNVVCLINPKHQEDRAYLQITAFYPLDKKKLCDLKI
ncbi:hypothetical protein Glove_242g13 [Diversispora epigaea]|uniref:Uncharacterized protein n=1 Tax=Diversispora epigaea TaxID=1348612 RepID=A0A397IE58_9GLOM|nr:hypothetical protein Glove_242g13 [Diversispora epigaea]